MIKIIKSGKPLDYYMTTCRECYTTYLFQDEDLDMTDFPCCDPEFRYGNLVCPQCKNRTWGLDEIIYYCDEDGNSRELVPRAHSYNEE